MTPESRSPSRRRPGLALFALLVAAALAAGPAAGAKLYKWVDEEGVTQFTQHPPPGTASEELTIRHHRPGSGEDGPGPAGEEGDGAAGADQEAATRRVPGGPDPAALEAARAANCKTARRALESLLNAPRLRTRGPDGEVRWIAGEERQERIDAARENVERYCD